MSLSTPADSLAVAGRRCRNEVEGIGGGRKARESGEREAPHSRCFYEHLARCPLSPQFA